MASTYFSRRGALLPTRRRRARPRPSLYGTLLNLWRVLQPPEWLEGVILWWINPRYLIGVCGLIWDAEGRLLLARHSYLPPPGWNLPGGWLSAGEALEAGVRRELREELSFDVEVGPLTAWEELWPPRHWTFAFDCTVRSGSFRPNAEIVEIAYFAPDEARRLISPRVLPLLDLALRRRAALAISSPTAP